MYKGMIRKKNTQKNVKNTNVQCVKYMCSNSKQESKGFFKNLLILCFWRPERGHISHSTCFTFELSLS